MGADDRHTPEQHRPPREHAGALEGLISTRLRPRRVGTRRTELHICPECSSQLVYPTKWEPAGEDRWAVELRCPECEYTAGGTWNQAVLDRFDLKLEAATETIIEDLMTLSRVNFEEDVERFISALHADFILPIDF